MRSASLVQPDSPWSWLVGSYDGVIGWGALALIGVIIAGYVTMTRRSRPAPAGLVAR